MPFFHGSAALGFQVIHCDDGTERAQRSPFRTVMLKSRATRAPSLQGKTCPLAPSQSARIVYQGAPFSLGSIQEMAQVENRNRR